MKAQICAVALAVSAAWPMAAQQTQTDDFIRYELREPMTSSFKVTYEVSATTAGAKEYVDPIPAGAAASAITVRDLMTGDALTFTASATAIRVTLARPVPPRGQARIRIEKTINDRTSYRVEGGVAVFRQPSTARRGSVTLPPGFALAACNYPSQILALDDGRTMASFMRQAPGDAPLVVRARDIAQTGEAAKPKALTTARSWEPPSAQGPTERARLTERAYQDRDIVYFLQEPSTNAFSLYHDYTESRAGTDKYINVVRSGSTVSKPSAYVLDTGEVLPQDTLKGAAITAANVDIGQPVTPETEAVVIRFPPVKAGQSIRLRISETYTAPQSYRLDNDGKDFIFERSLGRPRNSVVLPAGWYLTASAIPSVVSETPDGLTRLDFVNGRTDGSDVYIKGRKRR